MAAPRIVRHPDPDALAVAVADLLLARLGVIQAEGRIPAIALTGGSIADAIHREVACAHRGLRRAPTPDVDWSMVDIWFGDERFVPGDSPDRNVGQAAEAMLDHLPLDPARVHAMPASDGEYGDDVDAAADGYAGELERAATSLGADGDPVHFDVLMLGIGPDGHCASLFPGRPEIDEQRPVVAVRNSPKPPPTRITLTLGPLNRADEVWWVAAGQEKAEAVRSALSGADPHQTPASGPQGLARTLWFLDAAAASHLSPDHS